MKFDSLVATYQQHLSGSVAKNEPSTYSFHDIYDESDYLASDEKIIQVSVPEQEPVQLKYADFSGKYLSFNQGARAQFNVHINTAKTEAFDKLLRRLPPEQQAFLQGNSALSQNNDFIGLASQLNNKELKQLTEVLTGLQSVPVNSPFSMSSKGASSDDFIVRLSQLDDNSRSRVLQQASELFEKVATQSAVSLYKANGQLNSVNSSEANQGLHNFIKVMNSSADIVGVLDNIQQLEEDQQASWLVISNGSIELGLQVAGQLAGLEKNSQDMMLNHFAELASSLPDERPDAVSKAKPNEQFLFLKDIKRSDAVTQALLSDSIELLESYQFNDEQMGMVQQLDALQLIDQQTFTAITQQGLETIVGQREGDKIDLSQHKQALNTVAALRADSQVRELVAMSAIGNKVEDQDHLTRYTLKDEQTANKDQQAMVQMLSTDAWIRGQITGDNTAEQSHKLAKVLLKEIAENRDAVVAKLNAYSSNEQPLNKLSQQELTKEYSDSYVRSSTLAHLDSSKDMYRNSFTSDEMSNAYWYAYSLAGDKVEEFDRAMNSTALIRTQIIQHFANSADQVANGVLDRAAAETELNNFIDFMQEEQDFDKKQQYINQLTGQDVPIFWGEYQKNLGLTNAVRSEAIPMPEPERNSYEIEAEAWQAYFDSEQ